MADNFGLKIGIEGEREFKSALRDINQSFKVLASEMNLVSSRFDKNDKSIQAATARNQVLNKEIDAQKEKISTLEKALANATESFGENDSRTKAWAAQLNNAKAELNGMERELEANNKALDTTENELSDAERETEKFGKSVDSAGRELSDAEKETGRFGKEVGNASEKTSVFGDVLKAVLTAEAIKAGFRGLVNMVKEVGAAVKGYITEGSAMAQAASENHAKLAQVMRNTMEASDDEIKSMVNLAAAQEKLGVVSKTAQVTALAELASFVERKEAMEDMLPVMNDYIAYQYGTTASEEQARNVATSLGKAIQGNIDGLSKQGFTLTKAQKDWFKTANEAERVAFVMDMVGESMGGVNEALAQTDAGKMVRVNAVMNEAKQTVGELANATKAQIMGQMLPSIDTLASAFMGIVRGEGSVEEMAGAFGAVFDGITDVINDFLPRVIGMGAELIEAIVTGISTNSDKIIEGFISAITMLSNAIIELLPLIMEAGAKLLFALIQGIIELLPTLAATAIELIVALAQGLADSLPRLIPAIIQAILLIVKILLDNLDKILTAALKIIEGLALGLIKALPVLVAALPGIIAAITTFLTNAIPEIIAAGLGLFSALVGALPEIITAIVAVIPLIIDGIVGSLFDAIPLIIDAGISLLTSLVEALPDIITAIVKAIPVIIDSVLRALRNGIPQIIDAGIRLLTALVKALPEIITAIVAAIPVIIDSVIAAVIGAIPLLIDAGIKLLVALIQALPQIITTIVKAIPQIISSIVNALIGNIDKIIMAGVELFIALIKNLPTIIIEIVKAIPQIIKGIVEAIAGLAWMLVDAGANLIRGLWQGIKNMTNWLWDKIKGFFNGIWSGIKGLFGINSPSTVFAGLGVNMAQGLGIGFQKQMNQVSKDMQNAIPRSFDLDAELNTSFNAVNARPGQRANGQIVNQTMNVTTPKPLSERELSREFKNLSRKLALGVG